MQSCGHCYAPPRRAYRDFPPGRIPLVALESEAGSALAAGAHPVRQYTQSLWLKLAFEEMYRHVERFYQRLDRAKARVSLGDGLGAVASGSGNG